MNDDLYLGIDVGGTKCVALIGTEAGEVVERVEWASDAANGATAMLERIRREARKLMETTNAGGIVQAVGVAIGGPMDAQRGVICSPPNLPGWDMVPLKECLREWLDLPAYVEHDAAACALAEYLWGGWGKPEVLAYLTCGTGFGLGLVVKGRVYGGAGGRRPEVGHWRLREDGPAAFGKAGSAEAMCSGSGLEKIAAWRFPQRWREGVAGRRLVELAMAGDGDAKEVLAINARYTGRVCSMLADLLTPDVITLGSLARYLGEDWLAQVRAEFARETESAAIALCRVEPAGLGARVGDLSALAAAVAGARTR